MHTWCSYQCAMATTHYNVIRDSYLVFRVFEAERSSPPYFCAACGSLFQRRRVYALHCAGAARLGARLRVLVSKQEFASFSETIPQLWCIEAAAMALGRSRLRRERILFRPRRRCK